MQTLTPRFPHQAWPMPAREFWESKSINLNVSEIRKNWPLLQMDFQLQKQTDKTEEANTLKYCIDKL